MSLFSKIIGSRFVRNTALPLLLAAGVTAGYASCKDNNNHYVPNEVHLVGSVQKGPFIQGSDIKIELRNDDGNSTGSVYTSTTSDNLGNFDMTMASLPPDYTGNVSISGTGYYYKEVAGKLSDAQQTLMALYRIDGPNPQAHLNLITHLAYKRALYLFQNGTNINDAISQSETELREGLDIVYPQDATPINGTSMDIFGGDTAANEYLLAVSCIFENAVGSSDSGLQDLLNGVQTDLETDGTIDSTPIREALYKGETTLDPAVCMDNLEARMQELFVSGTVPDITHVIDTDKDGVPNADDLDDDGDGVPDASDLAPLDPAVSTGEWCDMDNNICWEQTAQDTLMNETDAEVYCSSLELAGHDNFRVPTISELRTLVTGCPDTMPDGACQIGEDSTISDWNQQVCELSCDDNQGPGEDGCYLDNPALKGPCGEYSSSTSPNGGDIWILDFSSADIGTRGRSNEQKQYIRCVRDN